MARISHQAGRISATNLGRRISEGNGRDELAQARTGVQRPAGRARTGL
ncbi:hypothetical protein ACFQT0_09665 [Hymenobacter humi]|uniref:AraC family transcriptional regulator n=1 Tax=Hymenobacter humi TaxID=1411620 RepID=A0ABW2U2N8_9BACT